MRAKGFTMNIFYRPQYQSDITQFLTQLKAQNPGLEAAQREGRALLWDKEIDQEAARDMRAGRVAQKPYVYQTDTQE